MTKPTKWVFTQRRLRSAWASAQSVQSLRCALKLSSCGQRRLWSDWADAQADLSLRWAHSHFVGFVMSWLILRNVNDTSFRLTARPEVSREIDFQNVPYNRPVCRQFVEKVKSAKTAITLELYKIAYWNFTGEFSLSKCVSWARRKALALLGFVLHVYAHWFNWSWADNSITKRAGVFILAYAINVGYDLL